MDTNPPDHIMQLSTTEKIKEYLASGETDPDEFLRSYKLKSSDVKDINDATIGQSGNNSWCTFRVGMVTASSAKAVCTRYSTVQKNREMNIATDTTSLNERLTKVMSVSSIPAIIYGKEHESDAREAYQHLLAQEHSNVHIEVPGLQVCQNLPFIGASSDGIISCSCCNSKRLLEVKCIYQHREEAPNFAAQKRGCFFDHGVWKLNATSDYYYQIQLNLHLYDLDTCVLLIYTNKGIRPVLVKHDPKFCSEMISHMVSYYKECLLPYLFNFLK